MNRSSVRWRRQKYLYIHRVIRSSRTRLRRRKCYSTGKWRRKIVIWDDCFLAGNTFDEYKFLSLSLFRSYHAFSNRSNSGERERERETKRNCNPLFRNKSVELISDRHVSSILRSLRLLLLLLLYGKKKQWSVVAPSSLILFLDLLRSVVHVLWTDSN